MSDNQKAEKRDPQDGFEALSQRQTDWTLAARWKLRELNSGGAIQRDRVEPGIVSILLAEAWVEEVMRPSMYVTEKGAVVPFLIITRAGRDANLAEYFKAWLDDLPGSDIALGAFRVSRANFHAVQQAILAAGGELIE